VSAILPEGSVRNCPDDHRTHSGCEIVWKGIIKRDVRPPKLLHQCASDGSALSLTQEHVRGIDVRLRLQQRWLSRVFIPLFSLSTFLHDSVLPFLIQERTLAIFISILHILSCFARRVNLASDGFSIILVVSSSFAESDSSICINCAILESHSQFSLHQFALFVISLIS
jgi:hypothetical protein